MGLIEVKEVSGVDGFVVIKGVIANFSKFISVLVCTLVVGCTVKPVLGIAVVGGVIDCFGRYWTFDVLVPRFVIGYFFVNRVEGIIDCVGLLKFEYVPKFEQVELVIFE